MSGLRKACGDLARALDIILPTEHLVDDVHIAEQIGDDPVVRLALYVVEDDRAAAIHVLLQPGNLEIRIDRFVGFDQIALRLQPFQRFPQIDYIRGVRKRLFFTASLSAWRPSSNVSGSRLTSLKDKANDFR